MSRNPDRTFTTDFKQFFVKGLAILLPSVLTLWIVFQLFMFMQTRVAEPINSGIRLAVIVLAPKTLAQEKQPEWFVVSDRQIQQLREERMRQALRPLPANALRAQIRARNFKDYWDSHWYLRAIGFVVAIVLIYLAGRLLGGYIGRRLYGRVEAFFARLPVFKQVYPHVKQVVEFVFGEREKIEFSRVVLVEYPRKGIWTVGLLTGSSMRDIQSQAGSDCVTIFIPSSPTPFTGYTITVPRAEAIDLPITVEEALRFVVTGGVLVPEGQSIKAREISEGPETPGLAGAPPEAMMDQDERDSDDGSDSSQNER